MDITLLAAKIFGVYLVVAGLYMLLKGKTIPNLLRDFFDHPAITYLTGFILLFLSAIYLLQYNIWDGTWRTIITVFVWLVLVKVLAYIFIPQVLNKTIVKRFKGVFAFYGLIAVIVGLYIYFLN